MKIAFYKGTQKGLAGFYNHLVRWWTLGKYSHVEILFSDGISASASFKDKGVRFKEITYHHDKWDFLYLTNYDEELAREWFIKHEGQGYDVLGNLRFALGFISEGQKYWFCSEAIAEALGLEDSWRYEPNILYTTLAYTIDTIENKDG